MKKPLLATFLALCLVVGLLPAGVMAAGGTDNETLGKAGGEAVPAAKFTIYKDGQASGQPSAAVPAGELSANAPDLSYENLYFDYAEVNGKRVYEAGTVRDENDASIIYYGAITGALSILEDNETINLYYVSQYPVTYLVDGAEKTAGDSRVKKGDSLTFRAKPSLDQQLVVSVNGTPVPGTVYDDSTGEMLFTVANVQGEQKVEIRQNAVTSYTLSYDASGISNGEFTTGNNQTVAPGGSVTLRITTEGSLDNYYALNLLVINGHEVSTPPSDAQEDDCAISTLPGGETVEVTLTRKYNTGWFTDHTSEYTVTISNVHTDLYISAGNCKLVDRNEIILKELTGVRDIVGWDYALNNNRGGFAEGYINKVFLQTNNTGSEFYFNLLPGYENPQLIVKVNGVVSDRDMYLEENIGNLHDGRPQSLPTEDYAYRFDLPNNLGDNIELFLSADPIEYSVEYRNDKNNDDLIGDPESGFTVVEGKQDTITITSRTPYDTVAGFTADGYVVEGGDGTVYHAGQVVKVEDVAAYAYNGTITFVPNWVEVEDLDERTIEINLLIEDPTKSGTYLEADHYLVSVGEGKALLRPNDERGREHLENFFTSAGAPGWAMEYNVSDFVLKDGEEAIKIVETGVTSLDFHYDVKKDTLTVTFAWGKGEDTTGTLPDPVKEDFPIKQAYSLDISEEIPDGYVASMEVVTGTMVADGTGVQKTVYLYEDADRDGKPDHHTITLTFDATDMTTEAAIRDEGLTSGGTLSPDKKTLTYELVQNVTEPDGGLKGDKYPAIPQVDVTTQGMAWLGWSEKDTHEAYSAYAGKTVAENAKDLTFAANYDVDTGYKLVTINYHQEKDDGTFKKFYTLTKSAMPGEEVTFTRDHAEGYVTANEGTSGTITVTEDGTNTVDVYYYLDKDGNGKPDALTITLSFTGTGHGSWDATDSMWAQMKPGKDYIYQNGILTVFLVKENDEGFTASCYPAAPKVVPESTYLFNSWQNNSGKTYGSGVQGDGITVGAIVGKTDVGASYTSVYDRDLNGDGEPDNNQTVTVTFLPGDHGTITGTATFEDLLPGVHSYPKAPAVTAEKGYQFVGWTPKYDKSGTVEQGAARVQQYTATYVADQSSDLVEIVNPSDITGVPNGTALEDIALPGTVTIRTTSGEMQANVAWITSGAAYDPAKAEAQTFTLSGTVTLPKGVNNPNGLPLTASIRITVDAKGSVHGGNLTYHANNGSGDTVVYYITDQVATVSNNLFTRVNYTFDSWNTAADGSGIKYMPNSTIVMSGNMDLYAQWVKNSGGDGGYNGGDTSQEEFELHYVTNGGTHLSVESEIRVWTKDYEDLPVPVREGYTFEGWYWDLRLTQPVTGDVKVDVPVVVLYAKWAEEETAAESTGVSRWLDTVNHTAYLSGYPDGTFGTDRNMTRAEVAQMFYALLLDKDVEITTSFSDVPEDAWYAKAVNTLSSLGMLGGYPDGTYRPDAPITRAEFAAVALAFANQSSNAACSYTDVNAGAWYYPYVAQASSFGWIGGYPDNTFRPDNKITRAEVCVIVNNMLGRGADQRYIDRNADELTSFTDLTSNHWAYYTVMEATNSHKYSVNNGVESWTRLELTR